MQNPPVSPILIFLVGARASGKTTVGRALARRLGLPFVDTDAAVTSAAGKTVAAIVAAKGWPAFRQQESAALRATVAKYPQGAVIATGGGCVTRPENYPLLHQNGTIFRLTHDLAKLPTEGRPISQTTDLAQLCARREPLYRRFADVTVSNDGALEATVQTIKEALL